jgi:hypothetical protein
MNTRDETYGSHEVGYFYHYIILDIFSRRVVGWCVWLMQRARGPGRVAG